MTPNQTTSEERLPVKKVALASSIGAIEWYDFFLYGTAAGMVFNKLFFTNLGPATGTAVAFVTFAVGFVAQPLGSLIFGRFGELGSATPSVPTFVGPRSVSDIVAGVDAGRGGGPPCGPQMAVAL